MARSPVRWLHDQLPGLVDDGTIDAATADRLRDRYPAPPGETDGSRVLLAVFGIVGALLIGAGVVLVLAHNWEHLSRPVRAGIAFGLLLAAQGLAVWATWTRRASVAWTEATSAALAIAVVATLALVAQTYHIGGTLPGLLFTWVLLIAPLPYLTGSRIVGAMVWAIAAWALLASPWWRDDHAWRHWWLPALLVAPFLVHLLIRRSDDARAALVGWTAAGSGLAALGRALDDRPDGSWVAAMTALFALYLVVGLRFERRGASLWNWTLRPWTTAGTGGLGFLTFLLAFSEPWKDAARSSHAVADFWSGAGGVVGAIAVMAIVATAVFAATDALRGGRAALAVLLLTPLWASAGLAAVHTVGPGVPAVVTVIANLSGLAVGVLACAEGVRRTAFGLANGGLLLIAAIAVARFFDTGLPFVARGVGFIVVGSGFLYVNLRLVRRRRARS